MRMAKDTTPAQYRKAFCARLKAIREATGLSQKDFAKEYFGLERDKYAKYETRSLLPHHLISVLSDLTGHDTYFILTGKARPVSMRPGLPSNELSKTLISEESSSEHNQ